MIQGQYEFLDSPYGVQLQNLREEDVSSGTHGQENISESHGDNQKHLQLQRNERTQQRGKSKKNLRMTVKDITSQSY